MLPDDFVRLKNVFRANQDELRVEPVEVVGLAAHPDLIIRLADGTFVTEGTYNLYPTRRLAVAALVESISSSANYYADRLKAYQAALAQLVADPDDDKDDASVEFPPPEHGGEASAFPTPYQDCAGASA